MLGISLKFVKSLVYVGFYKHFVTTARNRRHEPSLGVKLALLITGGFSLYKNLKGSGHAVRLH